MLWVNSYVPFNWIQYMVQLLMSIDYIKDCISVELFSVNSDDIKV